MSIERLAAFSEEVVCRVKSWRYASLLIGVSLLLVAIGLAVLAKPSVIAPRLLHAVTDLEIDSCRDCHRATHQDWYPVAYALHPETDAYAAVSGLSAGDAARLGELTDATRAYTLDDVHLPMSSFEQPRYLMPSGSDTKPGKITGAFMLDDWLGNCIGCHQPLRDVALNLAE